MIQRIQTVWLLLAVLVMAGIFYFPIYKFPEGTDLTIGNNYLAIALTGLSIILSLVAIFSFKNRKSQVSLCWVNILVCLALLAWLFYSVSAGQSLPAGTNTGGYYWVGAFLPLIAVILLFMARGAIRKDEKLIKSMDRLR